MAKHANQNQGDNKDQNQKNVADNKAGSNKSEPKKEDKKRIYIAKYRELRLVNKSSYTKEVNGRIVTYPGTAIQFHDGIFETDEAEVIDFLENHKNFGNTFIRVEAGSKEAKKLRDEKYKDLEQKNKEMKEKMAKLEAENKRLKEGNEDAGAKEDGQDEESGNSNEDEKKESDAPAF